MPLMKVPELSYENSRRLIRQAVKMNNSIDIMADFMEMERKQVTHKVNKAIFDLAEQQGVSVYEVCYHYAPVESYPIPEINEGDPLRPTVDMKMEMEVKLVPMKFEFEKGGGYWKDKYYRLKEKMQALIDNKED